MNILMLLDEISQGKSESGKVDALLSLKVQNPYTTEWIRFSELEDQHLTEAFMWEAELSEYTFTPVQQQQRFGPIATATPPPVSSGYGGIDLSKKYPPSAWKKAKRWLQRYGWIPAALASAGLTAYVAKKYVDPPKQRRERVSRVAKDFHNVMKTSGNVRKWAADNPDDARTIWILLNDYITQQGQEKPGFG